MAKGGKKRTRNNPETWSSADHAERNYNLQKNKLLHQSERTALLTHNTREKRDAVRLKLHITKVQRQVDVLRNLLKSWDSVEQASKRREEERKRAEAALLAGQPKKKRSRLNPETWKLRGAARPAWEVYDFDVRYVDPYMKEHEDAKLKAQRSINVLTVYKGKFADLTNRSSKNEDDDDGLLEVTRDYLQCLMQLGHLSEEAKQYKTARAVWLECMELEGDDAITSARDNLMRMYIEVKRYEAVLRLYQDKKEFLSKDSSAWIAYSVALASFEINLTQKKKSKKPSQKSKAEGLLENIDPTETLMVRAIQSNIFCAYYLCYHSTFSSVMEYTTELENLDDEPESTFEQALEYCNSPHSKLWLKNGAAVALKKFLMNDQLLEAKDLEWSDRLDKIVKEYEIRKVEQEKDDKELFEEDLKEYKKNEEGEKSNGNNKNEENKNDSSDESAHETEKAAEADSNEDDGGDDEQEEEEERHVDIPMFAGMFRTAMEMLQEAGELPSKRN